METIIFSVLIMMFVHNLNKKLLIENLALRQQLMAMKLAVKRPKIRKRDRLFWVILSRLWKGWKNPLVVVQPETVIRWHRKGFKLFWTPKSRKNRMGRPPVDSKTRQLIKDMTSANPLWGAPRIHGELLKLGIDVSERTIQIYSKKSDPQSLRLRPGERFKESHEQYFLHRFFLPCRQLLSESCLCL